jgi:hypothetical protein
MLRTVLGFLVAWCLSGPSSAEVAPFCRPSDAQASTLKLHVGHISSAPGADNQTARTALGVPFVPAVQVTLVSDEATCRKANSAFKSFLGNTGNNTFSDQVYVLTVGTVYAVYDPMFRHDPALHVGPILFLDSRFKPLSTTV